jgi:uncharacterized protein (DUF362 family)
LNRREFLKKATLAGVAGMGVVKSLSDPILAATGQYESEIIVAYGGEPEELLQTALKTYGGLEKLIKPESTVVIKTNFTWYGPPERACNTNPDLLSALVKACKKAGAKKVRVIDLTIEPYAMCLKISGIKKAVESAGGEVQNLDLIDINNPPLVKRNSGILKNFPIYAEALNAECLINVPILKHHGTTMISGSLKSLMGLTPSRDKMHAVGVDQAIVDLAKIIKPHLHIIDAYRILKTRGPQGPGDVAVAKQLIITHDPVAGDTYGASLLGVTPDHLKLAAEAGLGCNDLSKIKITKVNVKGI